MKTTPTIKFDLNKGLATLAAAIPCGIATYLTNGETGVGWFIVALLIIW